MPEDLRREVMERLRDADTRQRIADALITEAMGGPPDPKSGVPKGGATVIRAFELIRELALERAPVPDVAESDFSRYTDAELAATLARLEAASGGDWTSGIPPPLNRNPLCHCVTSPPKGETRRRKPYQISFPRP